MTKARDLANSAAAFASVSATELGYVDGVTSAIQTQMDAKAPSSTAVTLTGTQTLTNKTLTSPVIASVVNNTLTSTTGDIIYASAANTPARLGIGSSAQVLSVSGGIPAWSTPAAGAMTFITRSTASAVATVTLDSIFSSTYDTYLVVIESLVVSSAGSTYIQLRYGSTTETGGSYYGTTINFAATTTSAVIAGATQSTMATSQNATQTSNYAIWFNQVGNASEGANWHGTGQSGSLGPGAPTLYGCWNITGRTYTGIIFSTSAGNITGQFSVYGLAKA